MLNRTSYFDLLNVTSCISVIALHCNGFYHQYSGSPIWKFTVFVQVVFYCAVPIFFMLSGATLLNYSNRYSTKEFYKKRIKKTVIPYVFFTIAFYGLYVVGHFVRHNEIDLNLMNFFKYLSNGRIPFANYWFFIPLFCIYLLMPFLSKIVINSSKKELEFLIVIMFVFQSFLPIIDYFTKFNTIPVLPITGYVFFLFLGYYLAKYDIEKNNKFLISVLTVITGMPEALISASRRAMHSVSGPAMAMPLLCCAAASSKRRRYSASSQPEVWRIRISTPLSRRRAAMRTAPHSTREKKGSTAGFGSRKVNSKFCLRTDRERATRLGE